MSEHLHEWYLFHNTPPVEVGSSPMLILRSPVGESRQVELSDIAGFEAPLVTHSFVWLVDWFRRSSLPLPVTVIELELAKKLIVGRPKSEFKHGNRPWDMPEIMAPYLPDKYDQPKVKHALSTHLSRASAAEFGNLEWMETIAGLLPKVWEDLKNELQRIEEAERFLSIEVPVFNAMLASQLKGIRVDHDKRDALLYLVDREYVSAHHSLSIVHKINVQRAFNETPYLLTCIGLSNISELESYLPEEIIQEFKTSDPICSSLHTIVSTKRNKGILLRTFSLDSELCYPMFDTLGTVTGRILAVDPQLQYLKKEYRSLLVPRDGRSHLYVDYAQFEPIIMGSLSCDSNLLRLCCEGDLYTGLALRIFGGTHARDDAKTLFLAYSYGMGKYGLARLAARITNDINEASRILEENFFDKFSNIELWKDSLYTALADNGRIGTSLGNYRNRTKKGPLDAREKRWAVSQVVQGTGALILKRVIQKLTQVIPDAQMLLPMHDALLIEIPSLDKAEITQEIAAAFIDTFVEACPGTKPRVSLEPFAGTQKGPTMQSTRRAQWLSRMLGGAS